MDVPDVLVSVRGTLPRPERDGLCLVTGVMLAVRETVPVKPPRLFTVTVKVPEEPFTRERMGGLTAIEYPSIVMLLEADGKVW